MPNQSPIFASTENGLRLGLGGAPLGNLFREISDADAQSVYTSAFALGFRSFDTAPHYGHGLSEQRLGDALRAHPTAKPSISTKAGRLLTPDKEAPRDQNGYVNILPFRQHWDYSAAGIRRSVEDSLQRLGLAKVKTVFIHDCDRDNHGEHYDAVVAQVISEAIPELQRMKREGLIDAIGLGVNDVQVCLDVLAGADLDCLLLAGRYTLLDQSALPSLLPICETRGVRLAIGGVYNSGVLATGVKHAAQPLMFNYAPAPRNWIEKVERLETICDEFGVPLRAAALQFPLAHPAVEIVLVGAQNSDHLQDAINMVQHKIPQAFWNAVQRSGLVPHNAPLPESSS